MIDENRLKLYLEELAEQYPSSVIRRLERGSRVQKSLGLFYEIDDSNIDKCLGDFPGDTLPYGPIHRSLRNSQIDIINLCKSSSVIPFSKLFNEGLGECLEKAILVQLFSQRVGDSFLICGCLTEDDSTHHAYNIIFKNGKPFLVDAQNPLAKDSNGKIKHPYIAPVFGAEGNDVDFIVPPEWKCGRTYSIF